MASPPPTQLPTQLSDQPFVVATWNVNSLRMRQERLLAWLADKRPDVVCLQELKLETNSFPSLDFLNAGYRAVVVGQKTYNGVGILVRQEHGLADVVAGLGHDEDLPDPEARLIAATVPGLGVRVVSAYVPNGQTLPSDKYDYKLRWLERLRRYLLAARESQPTQPVLVCGDFNVAPDDRDVYDPSMWRDTVICHPTVRAAYQALLDLGFRDALRLLRQDPGLYTFWDYRMLAFPKNQGLRIDHILVNDPLRDRVREVYVDRQARKGKSPSDHAPLLVRINGDPPQVPKTPGAVV